LTPAGDLFDAAGPRCAARLRPGAGRADFLFSRVRRDADLTMEPRLDALGR